MHIEFWAVFFKMGRLLNLWVSGIFFFKENELVLFIAPWRLVGRVPTYVLVDAQLPGRSFSPSFTSWIETHQKWCKIGIAKPKGGKHAFLPIWWVLFTSCEFPFSGDTLWLAKHGKDATNVPFCSKQRPWHELAAKYNNSRLVLRCGTLHWKKEVNISTWVL